MLFKEEPNAFPRTVHTARDEDEVTAYRIPLESKSRSVSLKSVGRPRSNHATSRATVNFKELAATWDKGSKHVRETILRDFVAKNRHRTGPELERELGNGGSLLLTRITAWLRLTYLNAVNLALQCQAISIFISASSGNRFVAEFVEVGGVLTILEIVGLPQVKESEKTEAFVILLHICNVGRSYKEFICESYGTRSIRDYLCVSRSEVTQEYAGAVLLSLGSGNPKYLIQVFKSVVSLLSSPTSSVGAQKLAGECIRKMLPSVQTIHASIAEVAVGLLKSPDIPIQYEGCELLRELVKRKELRDVVLSELIKVLKSRNPQDEYYIEACKDAGQGKLLPANVASNGNLHHMHAAKLLGGMAATSHELAGRMISLQCVNGFLVNIGRVMQPESQRYAANALLYLVEHFPSVAKALREHMGANFSEILISKPDTFFRELTVEQIRYLRRNKVRVFVGDPTDLTEDDIDDDEGEMPNAFDVVPMPKDSSTPNDSSTSDSANGLILQERTDEINKEEEEKREEEVKVLPTTDKKVVRTTPIHLPESDKIPEQGTAKDLYIPYFAPAMQASLCGNKFSLMEQPNAQDVFEKNHAMVREELHGGCKESRGTSSGAIHASLPPIGTSARQSASGYETSSRYRRAMRDDIFSTEGQTPEAVQDIELSSNAEAEPRIPNIKQ